MIEGLFCFLIGILAHQLERPTDEWFHGDDDMARLAKYAEGGVIANVLLALVIWNKVPREYRFIVIACNALTWLCLGVGVAVGYILNGVRQRGEL